jgi:lipopolysaccharide transport system ATP-binding protein
MSDTIIVAENLSKSYLVGHQSKRESYTALRDIITREARNFAYKGLDFVRGRQIVHGDEVEEFWALRDVSFEVKQGEVLGVIGRNGAGKSTLLKILSRITEPSRGRAILRGRVASLLEVGTGFHPELTGRENVFLNGAILGMRNAEIKSKLDEIVAFADVERFLDTPVKRYSSGMYVRLAFSIAAHLEPDILVVDEVLAVGDADFQKKCLGKMQDVASKRGRTILFVSHNMAAISQLCDRTLLCNRGSLVCDGRTHEVIARYMQLDAPSSSGRTWLDENSRGRKEFRLLSIFVASDSGVPKNYFQNTEPIDIEITYRLLEYLPRLRLAIRLYDSSGAVVCVSTDRFAQSDERLKYQSGVYRTICRIPANLLNQGAYFVGPSADIPFERVLLEPEPLLQFTVEHTRDSDTVGEEQFPGVIRPRLPWRRDKIA